MFFHEPFYIHIIYLFINSCHFPVFCCHSLLISGIFSFFFLAGVFLVKVVGIEIIYKYEYLLEPNFLTQLN